MSYCCDKCFKDSYLIEKAIRNRMVGNCDYCGCKGTNVISVDHLTDCFDVFFDIYDKAEEIILSDIKPLLEHIQFDWSIFSERLNDSKRSMLLSDIYKSSVHADGWSGGNRVPQTECARFYDNVITDEDTGSLWERFCLEIKNQNRFILTSTPVTEIVDLLESKSNILKKGETLFRARIGCDQSKKQNPTPYSKDQLGKAPAKFVSDGRANPRGISYLYTATDIDTAISEVRPWKSALVSVATFRLIEDAEIVDLTMSKIKSPFEVANLRRAVQLQQLLEAISMEFSKPVGPSDSGIDYLPTQYIAELIKSKRFDGFKFKSSIANGENYVFFREGKLEIIETSLHRVDDIQVSQSVV